MRLKVVTKFLLGANNLFKILNNSIVDCTFCTGEGEEDRCPKCLTDCESTTTTTELISTTEAASSTGKVFSNFCNESFSVNMHNSPREVHLLSISKKKAVNLLARLHGNVCLVLTKSKVLNDKKMN